LSTDRLASELRLYSLFRKWWASVQHEPASGISPELQCSRPLGTMKQEGTLSTRYTGNQPAALSAVWKR
jgi:hypothetical protein